ncbi:MAG: DUF3784 domain-containing protein [Bacteroidales bacterium]|nr:DUF3784 domain-containing protein [Bacteroidales bacterium]
MIVLIILAAIFLIMGIIVLIGKGDNLIAGYNTASKEERSLYNVKRLRGLIGGLLIVLAPMMLLLLGDESFAATGAFFGLTLVLIIVVVILANTWAKKKNS